MTIKQPQHGRVQPSPHPAFLFQTKSRFSDLPGLILTTGQVLMSNELSIGICTAERPEMQELDQN